MDASATPPTPEELEQQARAAYDAGAFEQSITAWERLYEFGRADGDDAVAARGAAMVALFLLIEAAMVSTVRVWLGRARQHLGDRPEGGTHALVAMIAAYERFFSGDLTRAGEHAADAIRLGIAHDVVAAQVLGTVASARVQIAEGEPEAGLARLDEVGVLLLAGEVDPLTTGMMYCELICAAQNVGALDRASEWTAVMARWVDQHGVGSTRGRCRVHQAELLRLTGPVDRAEDAALSACVELRPWLRREFGWPLVELGDIRLRRGDLAGAEEAYLGAERHGWPAQPGLALLRLARGEVTAARELIDAAIASPVTVPSKEWPPVGALRLAPLLDAQAAIAAEARDHAGLAAAADALARLAADYPSPVLVARADLARGRERLLAGDADGAVAACTRAALDWTGLGGTYDAAVARLVLADAQRARGLGELARVEEAVARRLLDEYGAGRPAPELPSPARPARAVFRTEGGTRVVEFAGRTARLTDLVGLRHLARLLAEPGREFHVLDLVAVARGVVPAASEEVSREGRTIAGTGLPVLDDEARTAYRRRLAEIEEDLAAAEADHDLARIELAGRDRDYLVAELRRDVGLGGRPRTTGSHSERARTSVTRALRYAIRRLEPVHPELASHLRNTVHTGTYCSYTPEVGSPVEWDLGRPGRVRDAEPTTPSSGPTTDKAPPR